MFGFSNQSVSLAVCDDQPGDLDEIVSMTKELLEEEHISCGISRFGEAAGLLSAMEDGGRFDILLLDVMMEHLNGMELAAALRMQGSEAAIIFISSNRDMALMGYEVLAARYLAKPVRREKLREALLYCCRARLAQREILLPTVDGERRILLSDLIYIESWERGTRLIQVDGTCKTSVKISELERLLPKERFVLSHRTLLVNLAFVQSLRYCELTLKNGQRLPVSKYRQAQLKENFLRYLRGGGYSEAGGRS